MKKRLRRSKVRPFNKLTAQEFISQNDFETQDLFGTSYSEAKATKLLTEHILPVKLAQLDSKIFLVSAEMNDALKSEWTDRGRRRRHQRIRKPPGTTLNYIAEAIFRKRFYERVLRPCLAELQEEYNQALAAGRTSKARWIWITGVAAFWTNLFLEIPNSIWSRISKISGA